MESVPGVVVPHQEDRLAGEEAEADQPEQDLEARRREEIYIETLRILQYTYIQRHTSTLSPYDSFQKYSACVPLQSTKQTVQLLK